MYTFISGCPRSGTSALCRLLNSHPRTILGMERFKKYAWDEKLAELIIPGMFSFERFFDIKSEETDVNPNHPEWNTLEGPIYESLKVKYFELIHGNLRYKELIWGDKVPHYYRLYDQLDSQFENNIHWVYILRNPWDVAMSFNRRSEEGGKTGEIVWANDADYKTAVVKWNESLVETWRYLRKGKKMHVCNYDNLFKEQLELEKLMFFLNMEMHEKLQGTYDKMCMWRKNKPQDNLIKEQHIYVGNNANLELYNAILNEQYKTY